MSWIYAYKQYVCDVNQELSLTLDLQHVSDTDSEGGKTGERIMQPRIKTQKCVETHLSMIFM